MLKGELGKTHTMNRYENNPFLGAVPETVPLPRTPLTGVVVQIRFPEVLSIAKTDFVADFQERIRADYPINQQDQSLILQVTPDGAKQTTLPNWRFFDASMGWRVSLTTSFLALETRAYTNRQDFTARLGKISAALDATIKPSIMTRIGVRYVDRVYGDVLNHLEAYVRREMLGLFAEENRPQIARTINETLARTDVGMMIARWGFMPANQTHEPDMMPAIAESSWFLDVDVYKEFSPPEAFKPNDIEKCAMALATRAYGFFRWAVNDQFLQAYGGGL